MLVRVGASEGFKRVANQAVRQHAANVVWKLGVQALFQHDEREPITGRGDTYLPGCLCGALAAKYLYIGSEAVVACGDLARDNIDLGREPVR